MPTALFVKEEKTLVYLSAGHVHRLFARMRIYRLLVVTTPILDCGPVHISVQRH